MIVSGSIINTSTVYLNGIWLLIWHYILKPVLGGHPVLSGHYSIPRGCPLNTGFTVLFQKLSFKQPQLEFLKQPWPLFRPEFFCFLFLVSNQPAWLHMIVRKSWLKCHRVQFLMALSRSADRLEQFTLDLQIHKNCYSDLLQNAMYKVSTVS